MIFVKCSKCPYKGKKKYAIDHYLKRHVPENDVPYFCLLCRFKAPTQEKWDKHVNTFTKHKVAINKCQVQLSDRAYCKSTNKKFELEISENGHLIPVDNPEQKPVTSNSHNPRYDLSKDETLKEEKQCARLH